MIEYRWNRSDEVATSQQKRFGLLYQEYFTEIFLGYFPEYSQRRDDFLRKHMKNIVDEIDLGVSTSINSDNLTLAIDPETAGKLHIEPDLKLNIMTLFEHELDDHSPSGVIDVEDVYNIQITHTQTTPWKRGAGIIWRPKVSNIALPVNDRTDGDIVGYSGAVAVKDMEIETLSLDDREALEKIGIYGDEDLDLLARQTPPSLDDEDRSVEFPLSVLIALAYATGTEDMLNEIHEKIFGIKLFKQEPETTEDESS